MVEIAYRIVSLPIPSIYCKQQTVVLGPCKIWLVTPIIRIQYWEIFRRGILYLIEVGVHLSSEPELH